MRWYIEPAPQRKAHGVIERYVERACILGCQKLLDEHQFESLSNFVHIWNTIYSYYTTYVE
jgi:hypothetical protein